MLNCKNNRHRIVAACQLALIAGAMHCATAIGQGYTGTPTIKVDAREVQLPVDVLRPNGDYFDQVLDLTPEAFHVYVQGEEQRIARILQKAFPVWDVRDDYGYHGESATSAGVWFDDDWKIPWTPPGRIYSLVFVPSRIESGACYKISVVVDRPGVTVSYPNEYCSNTSPGDPLGDTPVGLRLQAMLRPERRAYIQIASSEGTFLSNLLVPRTQVSLEFPRSAFQLGDDHSNSSSEPIALLGRIYGRNLEYLQQFSDLPASSSYWIVSHYIGPVDRGPDVSYFFDHIVRYTRQFDIPAGGSSMKLVVANGGEFGRVDIPIDVPKFDRGNLWLSSIFLCKRFHRPAQDELERLPSQYTPLMSQGVEFTPAGDTRFAKVERLLLWFQIYAPPRSVSLTSSLHYDVKVVNIQTGKVESDGGMEGVHDFLQPGQPIVPVWKEIAISNLAPGAYRVDVQATDSVTESTVQSSSTFTIVKKK